MTIVLIIGTIASVVGFLLIHPQLNKELAQRFLYWGAGASLVTLSGFVIKFISTSSVPLYLVFQFFFLSLGIVHALLIFRYRLLGEKLSDSPIFSTLLTVVLMFAAALGFSLVSRNFLNASDKLCPTCILPFSIPFFLYQSYKSWQDISWPEIPRLILDIETKLPSDESEEMVILKFSIAKRYTGLRGIRRVGTSFPLNWTLSDAFRDTIQRMIARESKLLVDERHRKELMRVAEWRLYWRPGRIWKENLDPAQTIGDSGLKDGDIIYAKRVRIR